MWRALKDRSGRSALNTWAQRSTAFGPKPTRRLVARPDRQGRGLARVDRGRRCADADALLLVTAPENYAGAPAGNSTSTSRPAVPSWRFRARMPFVADVLKRYGTRAVRGRMPRPSTARLQLAAGTLTTPSWPSPALEEFTWAARSRQLADVFESCSRPRDRRAASKGSSTCSMDLPEGIRCDSGSRWTSTATGLTRTPRQTRCCSTRCGPAIDLTVQALP